MQKPKPQSTQAPFCITFLHETFSLFQHHSNLFKTTLLMNTNMDQRSKYTLLQRYNKIWTKIKAKTKAKRSSRKREHSLNDKSEKRSVLGK
jgi:hypothetical protein